MCNFSTQRNIRNGLALYVWCSSHINVEKASVTWFSVLQTRQSQFSKTNLKSDLLGNNINDIFFKYISLSEIILKCSVKPGMFSKKTCKYIYFFYCSLSLIFCKNKQRIKKQWPHIWHDKAWFKDTYQVFCALM